ncbi:MAG: hypothetical protein IJV58_10655, partial [Oscillospiraceae bacterium]|nr:hypothetical protein [Oscillospiraceae bacterium]
MKKSIGRRRRFGAGMVSGMMCLSLWTGAGSALTASALTTNNTAYNKTGSMVVEYLDRGINAINT